MAISYTLPGDVCFRTTVEIPDFLISDCPVHSEKMRIYCRTDRCLCCSYCETIGDHKGHDCFQVHEAEERERAALQRLQEKVWIYLEI